jgi:hypothetical protein
MNLHVLAAQSQGVPGLPAYHPPAPGMGLSRRGAGIGATRTFLGGPTSFPPTLPSGGAPAMSVARTNGGGVITSIRRRSEWTEFLTDADMAGLLKITDQILREAEALSRGTLTLADLVAKGHPYGRGARSGGGRRGGLGRLQGARAGVSNLAVINQQSGELARSWKIELHRSKDGIEISLINTAPYSPYLALGSKTMKAHGPFTTAPARFMAQLNQEWLSVTRAAWHRAQALQNVTGRGFNLA